MEKYDNHIDDLQISLDSSLGVGNYPVEMIGDLDDLTMTLGKARDIAIEIVKGGEKYSKMDALKDLYSLEIVLIGELNLIIQDLVPNIQRVRNANH